MNASTFNTNTTTSHTAYDGMRSRAATVAAAGRDSAMANTTVVRIAERCNRSASTQTANVPQNWKITLVGTSSVRLVIFSTTRDSTSARAMLPAATTTSVPTSCQPNTKPAAAAPTAKR